MKNLETLKTTVVVSALGLGVATGVLVLAKHIINKAKKNKAERSSTQEGSPTTFAKQLHMAFQNDNYFGWGTNNELVKQVFTTISSKRLYDQVQKAYFNLYQKNLNADLEDEMSAQEYNELIRILSTKRAK
jgi:hypothetical protein